MTATGSTLTEIRRFVDALARAFAGTDRGWRATLFGLGIALGAALLVP